MIGTAGPDVHGVQRVRADDEGDQRVRADDEGDQRDRADDKQRRPAGQN